MLDGIAAIEAGCVRFAQARRISYFRHLKGLENRLTAEDVKSKIDLIRAVRRDYEVAHSLEDDLLWEFVECVADACDDRASTEIAPLLLEWRKESADHPRHCA